MIKKFFAFVILLSMPVLSAPADSDCPPVPVFVECPGSGRSYISACSTDTVFLQVKAVHPNADSAQCIRYHLEEGLGQVDEKTGVWSYFYESGDFHVFDVEISASIGQSGHRTEGDENCRFRMRVGISSPDIRVNLPGYPKVILTQAPGQWSIPLYVYDYYNCGYTLQIDSVSPSPAGELYLDDDENIIFKPLSQDADKRFYLKLKSQNQRFESRLTLVLDTRRRIPVPQFRPYPDTLKLPYCSYSNFYKFQAFDPEYNDSIGITYEIASGPGYIDKRSGYWHFYASKEDTGKAFQVEIAALYANSVTSSYNNARFTVIVTGNEPPELTNREICGKELNLETLTDTLSLFVSDVNECDPHKYFFEEISPQPAGTIEFGEQLQHKIDILINLAESDRGKSFSITAGVTDGPDTAYCDFILNVDKAEFSFMIELEPFALPGKFVDVDLIGHTPRGIGGFDFLIGYNADAITFMGANTNNSELYTECGWEYFEYRFGPFGTPDSTAPSGQLRVVGMAETNNGNYHPSCFNLEDDGVLFTMKYLVDSDFECGFAPIRFYWYDCTDNTVSNQIGTELYIANKVYDFIDGENWNLLTPDDVNAIEFPTYEGAMESCVNPGENNKPAVSRNIDFYNGGIATLCNDTIDITGDINLNGIAYEIADALLFRDYFLKGLEAFGPYYAGSTAASDVNYDSIPLTVEDFVYMIRVIVGDLPPHPDTVYTCEDTAKFSQNNGMVTVDFDSADSLGAVYLKVQGEVTPVLEADSMEMEFHYDSTYTNIIIYSFDVGKAIHGGPLVSGIGDKPLVEAATATYMGAKVISEIDYTSVDKINLRIGTYDHVLQGQYHHVNVYLDTKIEIGGFDLLISYDNSVLTFIDVFSDSSALYNTCEWEYFTYRTGPFTGCDSTCPAGLVRIVGLAEINNGDIHPSCFNVEGENILFTLTFLATNDRSYECQFTPVQFFWIDCMDNVLSDKTGNILYVSNDVYDYDIDGHCTGWCKITPDDRSTITFPSYAGTMDSCLHLGGSDQTSVYRGVDFYNGSIQFLCKDSIDPHGDLNIDGIAYTYFDWALFAQYFIYGLGVFEPHVDGSILNSDINRDGIPLTVEDYMLFIRIRVGDVSPLDSIPVCNDTARFTRNNSTVAVDFDSADSLGAVYLKVQGEVTPVLETSGMEMDFHYDSAYTNIIIYSFDMGNSIHSGLLVSGIGNKPLVETSSATYYGAKVTSELDYLLDVDDVTGDLPVDFSLGFNYPNPFNPATTFEYSLPYACEVELTVYNIRGQIVKTLVNQTMSAGRHTAVWRGVNDDGQTVASGVYFYRIRTDKFVATKKMVLMK